MIVFMFVEVDEDIAMLVVGHMVSGDRLTELQGVMLIDVPGTPVIRERHLVDKTDTLGIA
jgi:hypothetical protein